MCFNGFIELVCVSSLAIWRTGRCKCTLRSTGKERRTWMVTVWPFGILRNVCKKVNTYYLPNLSSHLIRNTFLYIVNTLPSCSFTGPVFGNMDNFTGLGVFVDTYPNEEKHLEVCWSSTVVLWESKIGSRASHGQICVKGLSMCSFVQPFGDRRRRKDILLAHR